MFILCIYVCEQSVYNSLNNNVCVTFKKKKKRTTTKNQRRKTIFTQVKEGKRKETKIKGGGECHLLCCYMAVMEREKATAGDFKNAIQRYSTEPDAQTHTGITRIVYIILLI